MFIRMAIDSSFPSFRLGTHDSRSFRFAVRGVRPHVKTDPPPSAAEAA
jgi:hypothetical protein